MNKLLSTGFYVTLALFLVILFANIEYFDLNRYNISYNTISLIFILPVFFFVRFYFYFERKSTTALSPDKLFILLYLFMIYPGVILLSPKSVQDLVIVSNSLSIILFIIGNLIAKGGLRISNINVIDHVNIRFNYNLPEKRVITNSAIIISVLLVIFFFSTGNFNRSTALTSLINLINSGSFSDLGSVSEFRTDVYSTGGFHLIIGNYISGVFLPIIFVFLSLEGRKTKRSKLTYYSYILFVIILILNFGTGSRLITMKVFLYFGVAFSFLIRIKTKMLLKAGVIIFSILTISTVILGRGNLVEGFGPNVALNTERSLTRLFLIKGGSTSIVYEYYPHIEDFESGKTIMYSLLGSRNINEKETLARKMFRFETGREGTAGPNTFGDFYANFGLWGQLIGSFIIGLLFQFIYAFFLKKKTLSSFDIAFFSYLFLTLGYMGYSEFSSFKANGFHVVLFTYFIYYVLKKLLRYNN